MPEPQKTRLVVEAELPWMRADDLIPLMRDHAFPAFDAREPNEQLLREIGEVTHGLLSIRVAGEKDFDDVHDVPILFRRAWVEEQPPSDVPDWGITEAKQMQNAEYAADLAGERAHRKALTAFLRERLPEEWAAADRAALDVASDAYEAAYAKSLPEAPDA